MSDMINNKLGKRTLWLYFLILLILFFSQVRGHVYLMFFLLILFIAFLFFFILLWVHFFSDSISFSEKIRICMVILQSTITGEPQPLSIVNGSISSDYFLLQKKPKRFILLIKKQSAAIVQDDQGQMRMIGQGFYFMLPKWRMICTFDKSIQKIEFGPLLHEDPFMHIQQDQSLILQQVRNDRMESSRYQTRDNISIFISGIILFQIGFIEDESDSGYFLIPSSLNLINEPNNMESASGSITDNMNKIILSLMTLIMQTAISQFSTDELLLCDDSQINKIDQIVRDINLTFERNKPIVKSNFPYLTQNQINSINEKVGNIHFSKYYLGLTKVWVPSNKS